MTTPATVALAAFVGALGGVIADVVVHRAADREQRAGTMPGPGDVRRPGRMDHHLSGARWHRWLVPFGSALACGLAGVRWGVHPVALPLLFFLPVAVALAVVDLHTRRLPNVLTLPALAVAPVLVAVSAWARGETGPLIAALAAALLLGVVFLVLAVLRPAGMGLGDVKLAALIGICVGSLGVGSALVAVVIASTLAWVVGSALVLSGRVGRRQATPFGPWLVLGALIGILVGPQLFQAYLDTIS